MRNTTRQTRENRTITVDFRDEATYFQLLGDRKAFLDCVLAFILSIPTVSIVVTCVVVYTYGCDDGRIAPTRCAIIDAGLDGR